MSSHPTITEALAALSKKVDECAALRARVAELEAEVGRYRSWAWLVAALRSEHKRLRANRAMFPQVAEDYDVSLRGLRAAIAHCEWERANDSPFHPREALTDE